MFGYPGKFPFYRCKDCGHIFLAAHFTPEMLSDYYTNYYPRSNFDIDKYTPYPETKGFFAWLDGDEGWCHRHVPKNVKVLDIGCGSCRSLGYHKNRGCDVFGCDTDEHAQLIADRFGFNVKIGLFDPRDYEPETFDYVTMNYVMEHLTEPVETIAKVASLLKSGTGRFIATIPCPQSLSRYTFGKRWMQWCIPQHFQMFSHKSVSLLAEKTGMIVETYKSATPSYMLLVNWAFWYLNVKEGETNPLFVSNFEKYQDESFDDEAAKQWDVFVYQCLRKSRLFDIFMRAADFFGIGDLRLVVLRKK
ncbi:MAG: class I SAM-dependent methyltransferase [Planctomycetaceae bacterium]|jgi:SAM-dependent methyltransferase|nr:class I SAM-dependent methyltransferase [Planctomycetaceae bacterium]